MPPPQVTELARAAPAGLPRAAENRGVPFFPQTRLHCGPAALATALGAAGLSATPDALAEAVFLPARGGTLQLELMAGARRQGAVATKLPGRLEDLLHEVAAGHAVIVLQNLGLDALPVWHYAVLVGFDLDRGEVVLRSGGTERERLSLATFERTWARAGHWALAVLPPGRLPVRAGESDAAEAALGFERVAAPAAAATAYRAVLARWPDNLVAGFGLGHALHAGGDSAAAQQAFAEVASRHDDAAAWTNLARVQLERGQPAQALASARRALQRAESAQPRWLDESRATLAQAEAAAAAR